MNHSECPFCTLPLNRIVLMNDYFKVIEDLYPVTDLHLLIIPNRHVSSYFELSSEETSELVQLLEESRIWLRDRDTNIAGFNIGINDGEVAGQTVMHCHVHLIPRRPGDSPNPRGGVRGVIPEKQSY